MNIQKNELHISSMADLFVQIPHLFDDFSVVNVVYLELEHQQTAESHHLLPLT